MTQAKFKGNQTVEEKKKNDSKSAEACPKSKYFNDKCVQIAAWVLLTVGLCIIVTTFYLAINQQKGDSFDTGLLSDNAADPYDKNHNGEKLDGGIKVDIIQKSLSKKIVEIGNVTSKGCEEKLCKMICMRAEEIYEEISHKMKLSECNLLDALIIYEQHFDHGTLSNSWIDVKRTVQELAIVNSEITTIKSDAFNAPMFSSVFLMYWRSLNLQIVESGALLGLHSLKYLMIDSKINCLDRAFFQPVQTTLLYLKLNAGLTLSKDQQSIFGISTLEKLEYADLSGNNFNSHITKRTFQSVPNLKYLILTRCKITSIEDEAFKHLADKLALLDLSHNMLTTVSNKALQPLLRSNSRSLINIAMNGLVCDCDILPLVKMYKTFRAQFMDALYCKAPHHLYGKFIDEIDILNCGNEDTTIDDSDGELGKPGATTTLEPTIGRSTITDVVMTSADDDADDASKNVQMRCMHSPDTRESAEKRSWELLSSEQSMAVQHLGFRDMPAADYPIDTLRFAEPTHEFELEIFANHSAKVEIKDYDNTADKVNVVFFAEDVEDFTSNVPCITYASPFIITDPLSVNTTYTFCLVPTTSNGITPFNCLPLYVPPIAVEEDVWIARDQKQFTIGMLCLLFLMSTFIGAVIAYFGIRAYPDLLEGSKNVLVVKKSDKTCYVSTISEADYIKKASLKKQSSISSTQKFSLPDTPSTASTTSVISAAELDRLSSLKSSSTFFEDAFNPMPYLSDEYEMPKPMQQEIMYEGRSIPNTYVATSPRRSPPPLPKRNSTANITVYAY